MESLPRLIDEFEAFCGGGKHADTRRMVNAWKLGLLDDDKFRLGAELLGGMDFDEIEDGKVAQFYQTVLSGAPGNSAPQLFKMIDQASCAYFRILGDHTYTPILSQGVVYDVTPETTREMIWGSHGSRISQLYFLDAVCINVIAMLCTLTADYRVHFCHTYWVQFLEYVMDELDLDDLTSANVDLDQVWERLEAQPSVFKLVREYAHMIHLCQFDTVLPILDVFQPAIDPNSKHLYRFFWSKLEPLTHQYAPETTVEHHFYSAARALNQHTLGLLEDLNRRSVLDARDLPVEIETLQGGGMRRNDPNARMAPRKSFDTSNSNNPRRSALILGEQWRTFVRYYWQSAPDAASVSRTFGGIPKATSTTVSAVSSTAASSVVSSTAASSVVSSTASLVAEFDSFMIAKRLRKGRGYGPSVGTMMKAGLGVLAVAGTYVAATNFDICNFVKCGNETDTSSFTEILADIKKNGAKKYITDKNKNFKDHLDDAKLAATDRIHDAYASDATHIRTTNSKSIELFKFTPYLTEKGKESALKLQGEDLVCVELIKPAEGAKDQLLDANKGNILSGTLQYLKSQDACTTKFINQYEAGLNLDKVIQDSLNLEKKLNVTNLGQYCMILEPELMDFFVKDAENRKYVPLPFDNTLCVLKGNPNDFETYGSKTIETVTTSFNKLTEAERKNGEKVQEAVCNAFTRTGLDDSNTWPSVCRGTTTN
jgi:hypothetical protein